MEILHQVLQQLINGISLGSIYALIALGYTMIYGIITSSQISSVSSSGTFTRVPSIFFSAWLSVAAKSS